MGSFTQNRNRMPGKPNPTVPVSEQVLQIQTGTQPLRLNLGCGGDLMVGGVVNIDVRNLLPPDGILFLRASVNDLDHYFEKNSVVELWAKDILEHFPQQQVPGLVAAWCSLLAPGGVLHIKTPELLALARYVLRTDLDDTTKALRVYGGQQYPENFHKSGVTAAGLCKLIEANGLVVQDVQFVEDTNVLVLARKA